MRTKITHQKLLTPEIRYAFNGNVSATPRQTKNSHTKTQGVLHMENLVINFLRNCDEYCERMFYFEVLKLRTYAQENPNWDSEEEISDFFRTEALELLALTDEQMAW